MTDHEKWLAYQSYCRKFSSCPTSFPRWRGLPNHCKCSCGGVWYDKVSPVNWWRYFNPALLWKVGFLFPLFRSLHSLVWTLPPVIWVWLQMFRAGYKNEVLNRARPEQATSAIRIARLLLYGIVVPLVFVVWTATWILSGLGSAVIMGLHLISLCIVVTLLLMLFASSAIVIAMYGIVFVIGGAASVIYSYYPVAGVVLIVAGLLTEYERMRRRERRHAEQLGLLLLLQQNEHSNTKP